jgi:cysteine desulfurase family protein
MYYFDNASTTKKKPKVMIEKMNETLLNGCSPSRGSYKCALDTSRDIYRTRKNIAKLFSCNKTRNIILTPGATWSLNMALFGLINPNDHIITTSLEHNAVMRPLTYLKENKDINISYTKHKDNGEIILESLTNQINDSTKMIIINHASNINGVIMPLEEISKIAIKHGLLLVVDSAQTAGFLDIDLSKLNVDALAFTGHKSLLGPPGTGGLVLSEKAKELIKPIIFGGTGSQSERLDQPDNFPDKLESGTQNYVGYAALGSSVEFILNEGLENIRQHELKVFNKLKTGLKSINGIELINSCDNKCVPTLSIVIKDFDMSNASYILDSEYNIMVRSGLHCAPAAHKTLGTYPKGTIRFSVGYYNTLEEVDYVLEKMEELVNG